MTLRRIMVANRGEIAVRVIRAAHDAGAVGIAVYADTDANAEHVRLADLAVSLGPGKAGDTYLSIDKVLAAAAQADADSIHPGYGFLSENADFAQAVIEAGLVWIGPPPHAIRDLGDKVRAREIARRVGAPLVPGTDGTVADSAEVVAFATEYGLPVAIKAAFGGGGRGLKVARTIEEIPELYDSATREAITAFGRGEVFVERFLDRPRHVEAQVLADQYGKVIVVGTRDCSLQRRNQKLVEEAPAPFLTAAQEERIRESAKAICAQSGYVGAGTVEYLVGTDGTVTFLEVNTRLQVEHPVTEETAGVDLVREQFRIADGAPLLLDDPTPRGHSIEFRINAEDPARNFLPTPGEITALRAPEGPGVRMDFGFGVGDVIDGSYDSMLGKLVITGADRAQAIERSRRALDELRIEGITTVLDFDRAVVRQRAFAAEQAEDFAVHTRWIETDYAAAEQAAAAAAPRDRAHVMIGGRAMLVHLPGLATLPDAEEIIAHRYAHAESEVSGAVKAPMQGTVVKVAVSNGQQVEAGEVIAVVEAMKMENAVNAPRAGTVQGLSVEAGDTVAQDTIICELVD